MLNMDPARFSRGRFHEFVTRRTDAFRDLFRQTAIIRPASVDGVGEFSENVSGIRLLHGKNLNTCARELIGKQWGLRSLTATLATFQHNIFSGIKVSLHFFTFSHYR